MAANATAIWRVRPGGNNNNGAGYDLGIASAGTDFSQQNAAQVTQSGGTVSTVTTTLTDTGASFTSALIGNGIRVSGTGLTTTYTFITAVPSGTTLTLQTSPGATGSSVTYSIGGAWADWWTNSQSTGFLVPGNIVYILGTATPNPSSYAVDYTFNHASVTLAAGSTAGKIAFLNDPLTPGYKSPPDTTGGMPTTKFTGVPGGGAPFAAGDYIRVQGLWFIGNNNFQNFSIFDHVNYHSYLGCVLDQLGDFMGLTLVTGGSFIGGCEIFSSIAAATGGASPIELRTGCVAIGCNIHDANSPGITITTGGAAVINCIVAKCTGVGIQTTTSDVTITNCTIDGNSGNGIDVSGLTAARMFILNNIITNHTVGGTFGLSIGSGTAAQNDKSQSFVDYNTYYNNTTDTSNIGYGAHDTHGGSNPYVGQSTENYSLA
jgi:hypothetical protein